jgi:hypothetical protein
LPIGLLFLVPEIYFARMSGGRSSRLRANASRELVVKRLLLLAILAMNLPSCATSNLPKDTSRLESNEGVLVTNIVTNAGGYKLAIRENHSFVSSAVLNISSGGNFLVITLPAGDYSWRGLYSGSRYREFNGRYSFKIVAGAINYIGDMYIDFGPNLSQFQISIEDHRLEALQRFKESYPALAASSTFTIDFPTQ